MAGRIASEKSHGFDVENLPTFVVAAGWAGCMRPHRRSALRTLGKPGRMPAIGGFAGAQAHLRCFSFRNSHKSVFSWMNLVEHLPCARRRRRQIRCAIGRPAGLASFGRARMRRKGKMDFFPDFFRQVNPFPSIQLFLNRKIVHLDGLHKRVESDHADHLHIHP